MKKFFSVHYEKVLIFISLVFSLALLGYFLWGGRILVMAVNEAIGVQAIRAEPVRFDLDSAAKLNLGTN